MKKRQTCGDCPHVDTSGRAPTCNRMGRLGTGGRPDTPFVVPHLMAPIEPGGPLQFVFRRVPHGCPLSPDEVNKCSDLADPEHWTTAEAARGVPA